MAQLQAKDGLAQLYKTFMNFASKDVCSFLLQRLSVYHLSTYEHSRRVGAYSLMIAEDLGLGEEEKVILLRSALLHDIGKLYVPLSILNKPGKLTTDQFETIQEHCSDGLRLVRDLVKEGWVDPEVILLHHENLDGSGYPLGMKGEDLSLSVCIVRVADSYDAMTFNRGYNTPKSREEAIEELFRWKAVYYDPKVINSLHKSLGMQQF